MEHNTEEYLDVPKGQVFLITDGDYSDYTVMGVMQAVVPFNIKLARKQCEEELGYWSWHVQMTGYAKPNRNDKGEQEPHFQLYPKYSSFKHTCYHRPIFVKPTLPEFQMWLEKNALAAELDWREFHDYNLGRE
jgi:hypothetical protein